MGVWVARSVGADPRNGCYGFCSAVKFIYCRDRRNGSRDPKKIAVNTEEKIADRYIYIYILSATHVREVDREIARFI